MKKETDTKCSEKIDKVKCNGDILVAPHKLNRMDIYNGYRIYVCAKCGVEYKYLGK